MSKFKNNLNMFLTSMLILVLIGLVVMTLFFQTTINRLNDAYNEKSDEAELLSNQLESFIRQHSLLNTTLVDLNLELQEYTEEFEQTYNELKQQKNEISLNLNNTKIELNEKNNQLQNKINQMTEIKNKISLINPTIIQTKEDTEDLIKQLEVLEKDAEDLRRYIDNNQESNLTENEYLSILSKSKSDADSLRRDARDSKNNINDILNLIEQIKTRIDETNEIIST